MTADDIYHTRRLNIVDAQGVSVLDCIGWRDPLGGLTLRVFFKSGTDLARLERRPRAGHARFPEARAINGGFMFIGSAGADADEVCVALVDGTLRLPVQRPETALFAGLNSCLLERIAEPIEVIAQWLSYHVDGFGLEGVLLVDRCKPGTDRAFCDELTAVAERVGLKRLVHLSSDVSLGAELPPAAHPYNAPDAPGKDRMTDLQADPQTAPLADLSLYEWARWRFLGRARAVINLDPSDLLQPGTSPFEAVHDSSAGVIQLVGQRIFPWRVRPGQMPAFGDHICRQFDASRANMRWCLAPAKLGAETVWRLVRVANATPQDTETHGFWRAMAIRHPKAETSKLVSKTSLIEDDVLLDLAKTTFRHKPVRPPKSKLRRPPAMARKAGATCIVTCMKDEGPFILEWIAYHRAIGVENFLIYTNDCTDGTADLLNLLQQRGLVERRDNPFKTSGLKPQHAALKAAEHEPVLRDAAWAISMDVDEFINIHVGDGLLQDLYGEIGQANMISLTWRLFGNASVHEFTDKFVIDQFTRCAPQLCRKPHQAWGFKTLFRNIGIYKKLGVHRPKGLKPDLWDQISWVNGSGKPMPRSLLRSGWRSTTDSYGYDLVTLNHYAVRSAESFLVKRDRGRVNHVDRDQGLSYWFRMNNNWQEDRSILTKRALLQAEFDRLMRDDALRAAHTHCVSAHRRKIRDLRVTKIYEDFYGKLTSPRMERLAQLYMHFGANVFLAGPEVVPDAVLEQDVERGFFFDVERGETKH